MSGLCQGAGGVPGTGILIPGSLYFAQSMIFFFLSDSFFFEWAEESRPTTAKFGSCHGVDRHHLLAAMAATYALHVTLLVQTRDRTVDSHPPSRFVDSLFLQT